MKLKRILAIVLSLAMVLSTMSFNVFAQEATTVSDAAALAAALTSDQESIKITLANDIEVPMSSLGTQTPGSGEYKLGGENTKSIVIDLNNHKMTITTTYMSAIGAKNDDATIIIKNGSMNSTGNKAATWNINDLIFANCNYQFENVTFDKEVALTNTGKNVDMKNVTINGTGDYYALWIQAEGQNVTIDGLVIDTPGRGIKIDEQYSEENVAEVTLNVSNAEFNTAKKAAIMVKSAKGAKITTNNVDISGVKADSENIVWVDEDSKAYQELVKVNGDSAFVEGTVATVNGVVVADVATAFAEAVDGDEVVIYAAGTYSVPAGKSITIKGAADGVVFDNIGAHNMGGASVTFNNVTFEYGNENYKGLQHAGGMEYNNCTINGQVSLYGTSETFNNCTFNQTSSDAYNVWTYGAKEVEFNECTFNSAGKSVLIYSEDKNLVNNVTVTKSTFNASTAVDGKAAIEMDSSLTAGINLTIDGETTVNGFGTGNKSGNSLWNNKKGNLTDANNDIKVIVDGETVLDPAAPVVIEIYDWEDIKELDEIVEGGNTLEGVTVKLMNDIDLYEMGTDGEPVTFNPIGANKAYFKGIFDGQGHTIKNMYQSGWALGYDWDHYGTIGLFAYLWDATVKNLTIEGSECFVEGGNVAAVAGCAWGNCTFENIEVKNSILATYNNRAAGIVGYTGGEGTMTFEDITVDEKTVIAGLWGSFDSSLGGLIGSIQDPTKIVIKDVAIKCRLDAYNDCTAAYKYYAYRMCGMLIGKMPVDSNNKPILDNVTITDVDVEFDKWANYTYVRNGTDNENWKRVEAGYAYNGVDLSTYTNPDYNSIPFKSLFGGQQYGSYGQSEHENVEVSYAYVAKIGDNGYWTLAEALSNANEGDTIVLLKDVTEDVTINKSITLDGADFNYTGAIEISGNVKVTVKNVNFVDGDGYAVTTRGVGSVTVENCTVNNYNYGFLYAPKSTANVIIKDVTVNNCAYGLHWYYGTNATLENVKMTNVTYGVRVQNHAHKTVTFKNCEISGSYPIAVWEKATANQTFKFEGTNNFGKNEFAVSDYAIIKLADADTTLSACAGLNVTAVNEQYSVTHEDGTYKVQKIAKVGETCYNTLQEAIDASNNGDTITVIADVKKAQNVTIDNKTLVIDLDGHTVNGAILPSTGDITIKNGSIVNTDAGVSAIEINSGKLNLTNVNIESARHAVRIDGEVEAVIDGGTYKVGGPDKKTQHAVNISGNAKLTIKNGTFIGPKGTVADSGAAVNVQAGSTVTIENGTFTGGKNNTLAIKGTLSVLGGKFDQDPTAYVAENLNVTYDSFKKLYTVSKGWTISAEADYEEVEAGDKVQITIKASGENFTAADWKLNYESDKFEFSKIVTDIDDTDIHKSDKNYISGVVMNPQSKDAYNNDTTLAVYEFTAKAHTEVVTGDFTLTDASVGTVAMSNSTYPAATVVNDKVTILLKNFKVTVQYNGEDVVNNKVDIHYDGNAHKIDVTTEPDAKVWYSTDEGQTWVENVPEFTEYGEHKLTYKVDVPDGYDQTAKTPVTITVNIIAPVFLVEVTDYVASDVAGYKLVLVYTDVEGAYFTYGDRSVLMLDVSAAGYKYTDENGNVSSENYPYVYGYVVPAEMKDADTFQNADFYKSKVKFANNATTAPEVVGPYDYNINCDLPTETVANLADVVYTNGVYNMNNASMEEAYMKAILKADAFRSKNVNTEDVATVKRDYDDHR